MKTHESRCADSGVSWRRSGREPRERLFLTYVLGQSERRRRVAGLFEYLPAYPEVESRAGSFSSVDDNPGLERR